MSTYIVSDIHGCFDQYQELLRVIDFSDDDTLYVLGDCVDRGPDPIKVLLDIMDKPNAHFILGNHDITALMALGQLTKKITDESIAEMTSEVLEVCSAWLDDGGWSTLKCFSSLDRAVQIDILDFIQNAPLYETIEYNEKLYILVHGGLGNFDISKELNEYEAEDLLWTRPDYSKKYFPGDRIILVTGHTPTPNIRKDKLPLVYEENGHLAIDCGCVYGGKLAAYCIETGEVTYVAGLRK